jgi:hypothetical protein
VGVALLFVALAISLAAARLIPTKPDQRAIADEKLSTTTSLVTHSRIE